MPQTPPPVPTERAKRVTDSLLQVPGILAVRVWEVGTTRVEVGVRLAPGQSAHDVLRRAREATDPLRQQGETWHFGLLSEA
jgi:hypothetical protein